jgi:FKBP-type peptidyl-prolyl cis-trans isomerase (trigger factor)
MERHLLIQKDNEARQKMENELIEALTKDLDFKVPQTLVNRQLQDLMRQAKVDLALKGVERKKIEEEEQALNKELEPEARKQVKVYLVLSEIAKKENMPLDDQMPRRVMEFLLKEADWQEIN